MEIRGSCAKRTIVDFAELDVLAAFSKVGADAAVVVVIGIDDGVLAAGVTLDEEKKLLEQHVGSLMQSLMLMGFQCEHVRSSLPASAAALGCGWRRRQRSARHKATLAALRRHVVMTAGFWFKSLIIKSLW